MKKMSAGADWEKNRVRVTLGAEDPTLLYVWKEGEGSRAVAHLTKQQAIALAYKLLHAANAGIPATEAA